MEHELFQSKLKPSVDPALLSDIIRSSSSGQSPHRTAAMELIFESSIQGRRERALTKHKDSLRSDPAPRPMRTHEAPNISIPQAQPPVPVIALQPPSQPLPNVDASIITSPASAPTKHKALQDSPPPSNPPKKAKKVARGEEPPTDAKIDASPSEDIVQLVCRNCNAKPLRSHLWHGIYCTQCRLARIMNCAGCGTSRFYDIEACANCHKKFK